MSLKLYANIFAVVFLAIGILGFVPGITNDDGLLLGIFHVDTVHNIVHLASGVIALIVAMGTGVYAKKYFQIFGIVYGLVAIVGFVNKNDVFLFEGNMADNYLHVVIAIVMLWLGFLGSKKPMMNPKPAAPSTPPPTNMGM